MQQPHTATAAALRYSRFLTEPNSSKEAAGAGTHISRCIAAAWPSAATCGRWRPRSCRSGWMGRSMSSMIPSRRHRRWHLHSEHSPCSQIRPRGSGDFKAPGCQCAAHHPGRPAAFAPLSRHQSRHAFVMTASGRLCSRHCASLSYRRATFGLSTWLEVVRVAQQVLLLPEPVQVCDDEQQLDPH